MEYVNREDPATAFPDAYLSNNGILSWTNIIVSGEHKMTDEEEAIIDVSQRVLRYKGSLNTNVLQNSYKVVHSMSSCMNRDPRRRFAFGYTIETTNMRLWYYDRFQIVVSEPFNFITVRVFALSYGHS